MLAITGAAQTGYFVSLNKQIRDQLSPAIISPVLLRSRRERCDDGVWNRADNILCPIFIRRGNTKDEIEISGAPREGFGKP